MTAFAGYPLTSDGRVLGVLALFSRSPLSEAVIGDLVPISDVIAAAVERRKAESELIVAKDRAEVASRAKDNFLARLSHELRTPLTPVLMTAAALQEDKRIPADVRAELAMIERNIGLEARLIDDLLDLTRVTSGKLQLREEHCDAHSLIHLAMEIVQEEARAKPVSFLLDLGARCTALRCDPSRIQQVFWNLLRNAIKFTPAGGRITVVTRDDPGKLLRIEINDTGVGLAPEALEIIFHPFEQAGRENDHCFGGVGLGLTICQAVVELHGGKIHAESAGSGRGSTFVVKLPRSVNQIVSSTRQLLDLGSSAVGINVNADASSALRILLVEDHEPTLTVLTRLLIRNGNKVTTAGSVKAAVEVAQAAPFDLLVSDLGLPDGTGLEVIQKLHALQPELKAIALSGYGMDDDLQRSYNAGFSVHLTKPVDFDRLQKAIHELMQRQSG